MTTTSDTILCCISQCEIEASTNPDHRLEYAKLATTYWMVLMNGEDRLFDQRVCMPNICAWGSAHAQSCNSEERR